MKKRIRIKDIADKAGVSTGTVDRVLHNRGKVAPDVKKRVLAVMDELGYERNLIASALAYNKQVRIVALLPNPTQDPYWQQTTDGVQQAIKAVQHYGLLVEPVYFDVFDAKDFLVRAKELLQTKPQAMLFPPLFLEAAGWLLEACAAAAIPTVLINTQLEQGKSLCYIGQDSYQSGVLGARLLDFGLQQGQTACILNLDFQTASAQHLHKKEAGFRDYFSAHPQKQIQIIRQDFEGFQDVNKCLVFIKQLLDTHPKLAGIFVTNSRAYKVLECLKQLPERNIKIVGFDLLEANLEHLHAGEIHFLINQNPVEQGYEGVMSLFKHLILKQPVEPLQYLPLDIVVKENVDYYLQRHATLEVLGKTL